MIYSTGWGRQMKSITVTRTPKYLIATFLVTLGNIKE
jgi:hypothetical protein